MAETEYANVGEQRPIAPFHIPIAPVDVRSTELEKENRKPEYSLPGTKVTLSVHGSSKQMVRGLNPSVVNGVEDVCSRNPFRVEKETRHCLYDERHKDNRSDQVAQATNRQPRVLRFRETIESLFCLTIHSSEEHKQLCQEVVDGLLSDDARTWRRVLDLSAAGISPGSPRGKDLLRLYRRALSRFAASDLNDRTSSSDILAIWISYARCQATYGTIEDARMTFRRIQNQRLGICDATFYLAVAEVEQNVDLAVALKALKIGIEQKAEPLDKLITAARDLELRQIIEPSNREAGGSSLGNDNYLPSDKKSGKSGSIPVRIPPLPLLSNHSQRKRKEFADGSPIDLSTDAQISNPRRSSEQSEVSEVGKKKHISALSKTPRIAKVGINGKAQRVEQPNSSPKNQEHDLGSSQHVGAPNQLVCESTFLPTDQAGNGLHPMAPKVTKMDLSYILNWDPEATPSTQKVSQPPEIETKKLLDGKTKQVPSIAGYSSNYSSSPGSSSLASSPPSFNNGRGLESKVTKRESSAGVVPPRNERSASSDMAVLIANANLDFLPLMAESNVLRVNGKSYLKLNVIGSGGSCKVYRALSKDCSVVAIKRVKLDGIDRKTIDGYANEIALLKRLRDNPAIIEMYDSEVDLTRKTILLVLELGEVDLSQAIQQQATRAGNETNNCRSALSMNFIRLTWQQMLQAVHSIHEERIIHGDLKPANFLFVRGALKLIDFGIAKAIQSEDTTNIYRDDCIIGTLNYISPEAIQNTGSGKNTNRMKIGRASDIWSLGCILYQMVYGKTPFAELQTIPKLHAIINPEYEINFPKGADEAAVDAMKLCLRRNPTDRPPIVGSKGLLTEHWFLHTNRRSTNL